MAALEAQECERLVVGVCTYNRGARILQTLESLVALDQVAASTGPRLTRIVIVDNASTDDTAAVISGFASRGHAVPIDLLSEPRPGKTAAMQRLFASTAEELVGIIDDDTRPDPAWSRALLSLMDDQPRAGVAGGPVRNVWESGPTALAKKYHRSLGDQLLGDSRMRLTEPMSFLMGASLVIRRRALEESGWLGGSHLASRTGTSLECGAEDAELCFRIRHAGWEVWYEPGARMDHLIPPPRQTPEYLARLRGAIARGEPALKWVEGLVASREEALAHARKAERLFVKTLLFDWRPTRRRIRLAERRGRRDGWRLLAERLSASSPTLNR